MRINIAVRNPDFIQGASGRKVGEVFIVKPEHLFSWEETKLALEMRAVSKAKAERMVLLGPTDDGSTLASNRANRPFSARFTMSDTG